MLTNAGRRLEASLAESYATVCFGGASNLSEDMLLRDHARIVGWGLVFEEILGG